MDDDCRPETGDGDSDGDGHWHQDYVQISIAVGFQALEIPSDQAGGDCYDSIAFPVAGFDADPINGLSALTAAKVIPLPPTATMMGSIRTAPVQSAMTRSLMPMVTVMTPPLFPNRAGIYGTDCVDREDDAGIVPATGLTPADINPGQANWYDSQRSKLRWNERFRPRWRSV